MRRSVKAAAAGVALASMACGPAAAGRRSGPPTTHASIAVSNLEAALAQAEAELARGRHERTGELIGLLLTRGQFLGRIADYERAAYLADRLVAQSPEVAGSYLARGRVRAAFHRFPEALADLDYAVELGADAGATTTTRAGIFQATGRGTEARAARRRLSRLDAYALGAEALAAAGDGGLAEAESLFRRARDEYRDVSPFTLAWLDFQQGRLWMKAGEPGRARVFLEAAHERLPQYVAATGHLGEVEAELGNVERAIQLLREAAEAGDDPDPAGHLARVLAGAGWAAEAERWRVRAADRFGELAARHPEAFADHAAEFWLSTGEPGRALQLAVLNEAARPTVEAIALTLRAAHAAGDSVAACRRAKRLEGLPGLLAPQRILAEQALRECRLESDSGHGPHEG
jgi:tetratricopeptide (TPR) repeat protein